MLAQRHNVRAVSSGAGNLLSLVAGAEEPVFLVGWSMGAMIALEAIARLALPAQSLVVIGGTARFCACDGYATGVPPQNLRALRVALRRNPAVALHGFFRDVALPQTLRAEDGERKVQAAIATGIATLDAGLQYLQSADLRDTLDRIGIPALVLHGRQDRIIPWEAGEWLCKRLPRGTFLCYEEAGHDLLAAQTDVICSRIVEFLET
jgi:pimeloyl-[acyl-carrier protein] methyl ester esterase